MSTNNSNRFTDRQMKFVKENLGKLTIEEIAKAVNKTPERIQRFIQRNKLKEQAKQNVYAGITPEEYGLRYELRRMKEWKQIKEQFSQDERAYFEHKFARLMIQFNKDLLNTEMSQLFLLIDYDIKMVRNNKQRRAFLSDIDNLNKMKESILRKKKPEEEKLDLLREIDLKLRDINSLQIANTKEFTELEKRYQDILDKLKASRHQRINDLEQRKTSWVGLIKELTLNEGFRNESLAELALFNKAAAKEEQKLSQIHQYADNKLDLPILSHKTVDNLEDPL